MKIKSVLKKCAAFALSLCIMSTMLVGITLPAAAVTSGATGRCKWVLNGTVLTIRGNGPMSDYVIYPRAPWGSEITSVIIEDGVTSIGNYAFYGCTELTGISIPDSVTRIGRNAFFDCEKLDSIVLPEGITSISPYAFCDCNSLTSIVLPDSVTEIGEDAFYNCTGLTSVVIPDSVKTVGKFAFSNCSNLANITIGSGTTAINDYAFRYCRNLKSITIPDNVARLGDGVFYGCNKLESIEIPDGVKRIGAGALYGCTELTSASIGNSVRSLGFQMFYNCNKLTDVTIGERVASIGGFAFAGCSALENITIPAKVTTISTGAFSGCTALKSITLPDRVSSIGDSVFINCSNLSSITFGNRVKNIGSHVFSNCDSLKTIKIPNGVTSIGNSTFYSCDNLVNVTLGNNIKSIGNHAFGYCGKLVDINIPKSATSIGKAAFAGCTALSEKGKVYYCGSDSGWENISMGIENDELENAQRDNHKYEWVIDKQPTCALTGLKHEKCVNCNATRKLNTVIPATKKHTYKSAVMRPTATSEGYTVHTCKVCGDSYRDNFTQTQDGVKNMFVDEMGSQLVVSWDAYKDAEKYIVYVTDSKGKQVVTKAISGYQNSVALTWPTDIEKNKTYTIGVRVKTTKWLGTVYRDESFKNKENATQPAADLSTVAAKVEGEPTAHTVALSFSKIKGADRYFVYLTSSDGKTVVRQTKNTKITLADLSAKTAYSVKIQARVSGADEAYYSTISKPLITFTTA